METGPRFRVSSERPEIEQIQRNRNSTNDGNQDGNQNVEKNKGRQRPETNQKKKKSVRTNEGNTMPVQSKSKVDNSTETNKVRNRSENASKANRSSKDKVADTGENKSVHRGKQTGKLQSNKQAENRDKVKNTKDAGPSTGNQNSERKSQNAPKTENSKKMPTQNGKEQSQTKISNKVGSEADSKQKRSKYSEQNSQAKSAEIKNTRNLQPPNQGKGKKVPSCKDCKSGTCKLFNSGDIKAILASQRSNGALYYKVKWNNGTSDWYFPCKIPNQLISEYHANRTMSGKKRKKTLQNKQHKFFTEAEP